RTNAKRGAAMMRIASVAWRSIGTLGASIVIRRSETTRLALLGRQCLEAGRPPAGLDRFDEFLGEFFLAHLAGEGGVVVFDGAELDAQFLAEGHHRVPNIRPPVVGGTSDYAGVDDVTPTAEVAVPVQAGVRADDDVGVVLVAESVEKCIRRRRSP